MTLGAKLRSREPQTTKTGELREMRELVSELEG